MRAEIEQIVGAAALDEREVRDHWPLGLMEERDGVRRPKVLVARPAGREQVIAILRWASANGVAVTPMGGGTGVCGALAPRAGELVLDMGGFDRILDLDETNLVCRCESGVNGLVLEKHLNERGLTSATFRARCQEPPSAACWPRGRRARSRAATATSRTWCSALRWSFRTAPLLLPGQAPDQR